MKKVIGLIVTVLVLLAICLAGLKGRSDVPQDEEHTQRDEAADVMRCLSELLREPAFASTVVHLVSGKGQIEERKIAA